MSIPYTKGTAFSSPTTLQAWIEYPFRKEGDSATKVYHHIMQVFAEDYTTLADDVVLTDAGAKPARSPFPDDSAAYYVGDYNLAHIDDGLVQFDRQFANVPADRTIVSGNPEPNGLYAFEFPEVTTSISSGYKTSTGNESTTRSVITTTHVFNLSSGDVAEFAEGDYIALKNTTDKFYFIYTASGSVYIYLRTVLLDCLITDITSNTITCTYTWSLSHSTFTNPSAGDNYNGNVTTYQAAITLLKSRDEPLQANAPSFIEKTYIKSSEVIDEVLSLKTKFAVLDASGNYINPQVLSGTTIPTDEEYATIVYSGNTVNAENESIKRWKGNIFEKTLVKVVAK